MSDELGLDAVQRFGALGRDQLALRAGAFASAVAALAAVSAASGSVSPVMVLVVVGLAALAAAAPDSHIGVLTMAVLVLHQAWAVDDATTPWVIAIAASLLLMHTCLAAATVAPPGAVWTGPMRRRWGARVGVVCAVIVVAWAASVLVASLDLAGSAWLSAPAVLLVAVAAWRLRSASEPRSA